MKLINEYILNNVVIILYSILILQQPPVFFDTMIFFRSHLIPFQRLSYLQLATQTN